jgi:hypothetical protein
MEHRTLDELRAGLDHIRESPLDGGVIELIVARPSLNERAVVEAATLDREHGLVGDCWATRGSSSTADGRANPLKQVNFMNSRAIALIAGAKPRWPLAGDQFYVDLDLGGENLPPGTRLALGTAVVEITDPWHKGCEKFVARYGADALRFVRSPEGRELNLRGIHSTVVVAGTVRTGDVVRKVAPAPQAPADARSEAPA